MKRSLIMHKQDEHGIRKTLHMRGRKKHGDFFREYANTFGKKKVANKAETWRTI